MTQRSGVLALSVLVLFASSHPLLAQNKDDKKKDEAQKKEIANIVKTVDDLAAGQPAANDLSLSWLREDVLKAQGAHIDAFYHCPHHPDGHIEGFAVECDCRKPGTGMLRQAEREWPLDLSRSFLIGDRDGDMEAAAAFNIRGIRFDHSAQSLLDIVRGQIKK